MFTNRLRRVAVVYVAVTVALSAGVGMFVEGTGAYLVAWVVVSGLYTTPAFVVTWLAARRATPGDRTIWRVWLVGLVFVYLIGLAILVMVATGWTVLRSGGAVAVTAGIIAYGVAIAMMLRSRSGSRAVLVDVVEDRIVMTLFIAPIAIVFGDRIVFARESWWTIPCALSAVGMISALALAIKLYRCLEGNRIVEALGIALASLAMINAMLQVAQGVSGFTLPSAPLLAMQAACMGLVLLIPAHLPKDIPGGLDRLPPQQQVRSGGFIAALTLVAIPIILVEMMIVKDSVEWAVPFSFGTVVVLLLLVTLRQLVAARETKHLYGQVERAADERRRLLAGVMQTADADRHRVAAQLHEQAVSSYSAFVSLMTASASGRADSSSDASVSQVRDDFARQAESMRQLMLAIRPIEIPVAPPRNLEVPLMAFVDSLYGDAPAPAVIVDIDPDLCLDWANETIFLRIAQEALRNVWRHAHATHVAVSMTMADSGAVEMRISDDGIGFAPDQLLIESGIASMRAVAAFQGGSVHIDSGLGRGTVVTARVGDPVDVELDATADRPVVAEQRPLAGIPHLRVVPSLDADDLLSI